MFVLALVLLLSWGALAVGGWPSWAAAPTLVFAVSTGILGFLEHPKTTSPFQHPARWGLMVALASVIGAIGLQLVPLPSQVVAELSPFRNEQNYERLLAVADLRDPALVPDMPADAPRTLSIAPERTRLGLLAAGGFAIFLLGATSGLAVVGVRALTRAISVLGVVVSLIGMYRITFGSSSIYGLYIPLTAGADSAPFVNRNHQAGWLVMALALALGSVAGEVAGGMRGVRPQWRDRLIWLSTSRANIVVLIVFASVTMSIGILTTQSRSGALMLAMIFLFVIGWGFWKQPTRLRRASLIVGLFAILLGVIALSGGRVAQRFSRIGASPDTRVELWQNTKAIIRRFWITGTGFNTYGVAMLHYQTVNDGNRYIEAHNDYLQLVAEGGVLVAVPALILLATAGVAIWRRFREGADDTRTYWIRVGAVAGICAIALQSLTDFTLQMPGAFVMFATLLAIAIHHPAPRRSSRDLT
jgi:O-antigen ligase